MSKNPTSSDSSARTATAAAFVNKQRSRKGARALTGGGAEHVETRVRPRGVQLGAAEPGLVQRVRAEPRHRLRRAPTVVRHRPEQIGNIMVHTPAVERAEVAVLWGRRALVRDRLD